MVLRFTATVKKREVVVRGIDLPDGATVNVTIDRQETEQEYLDRLLRQTDADPGPAIPFDDALAAIRLRAQRGRPEDFTLDDALAEIRRRKAVRNRNPSARTSRSRARGRSMATGARKRTKQAR